MERALVVSHIYEAPPAAHRLEAGEVYNKTISLIINHFFAGCEKPKERKKRLLAEDGPQGRLTLEQRSIINNGEGGINPEAIAWEEGLPGLWQMQIKSKMSEVFIPLTLSNHLLLANSSKDGAISLMTRIQKLNELVVDSGMDIETAAYPIGGAALAALCQLEGEADSVGTSPADAIILTGCLFVSFGLFIPIAILEAIKNQYDKIKKFTNEKHHKSPGLAFEKI